MPDLIDLTGEALEEALCRALEPDPPRITARQAREATPGFKWVSCHEYYSPGGWWEAEIGTDHGPERDDDKPVRWRPLPELADLIELAWRVVDEMKRRGWLLQILQVSDGWVVNGYQYRLGEGGWPAAVLMAGMVQEIGDEAPEAICRAALAAMRAT